MSTEHDMHTAPTRAQAPVAPARVAVTGSDAPGDANRAPRVRLENVRLSYDDGATWALDGVSLELGQGERLCVLGPNGSGKSTLAQVLSGLEAPDAGRVELAGHVAFDGETPDAAAYRAARHRTGLVFQNPEDQIVTSIVADDVAFGPKNLGVAPQEIARRVDEELERVAMSAFAQADPLRLSGGQQQRVAIAGALAMHPDMLVLDEPGAMLDVRGRRAIMRVLARLQRAGTTLVHVTHFMDEALAADRVVVLASGRVVLEGTPAQVFSHAAELRELGLDVPLATHVASALGLAPVETAEGLAHEVRGAMAARSRGAEADAKGTAPAREGAAARDTFGAQDTAAPRDTAGTRGAEPMRNAAPALRVSHLRFDYGRTPALQDVTFEVAAGELVAVAGQTGSGKSTLARLVCALAKPDDGTIEVAGIDTRDRRRRRELRGTVGYVMQHPERQLFAETVFDDVAFGPRNLGLSEDEVTRRVNGQLAFLGLTDKAGCSPFDLSGGQQRLCALAGVLAMEPKVLVLDEPVAGLDPHGAERLREVIRTLHARGTTILMISHSMEDIAELADRMVVLDAGRIVMDGTPEEVFAHDEELEHLGLGLPAPLELARELTAAGVPVGGRPLTASALTDALRALLAAENGARPATLAAVRTPARPSAAAPTKEVCPC